MNGILRWLLVAIASFAMGMAMGCGDEEGQDDCPGFCLEEGGAATDEEQQVLNLCEDVCDQEVECFGMAPSERPQCVEACREDVQREMEHQDEACLEAHIDLGECFTSLSCEELETGAMECMSEFDQLERECDLLGPEPQPANQNSGSL